MFTPETPKGAQVRHVRPSSRIACAGSWVVHLAAVLLAWDVVLSVPDGRGDVNGLLVATAAGGLGLALIGDWLRHHEGGRRW